LTFAQPLSAGFDRCFIHILDDPHISRPSSSLQTIKRQ